MLLEGAVSSRLNMADEGGVAGGLADRGMWVLRLAGWTNGSKMSFDRLVKAVTFLAVFTMAVRIAVDTDTWWHLAAGRWMVEQGRVLQTDPFSFTRIGAQWINPSWLSQLLLYVTYRAAGVPGLNLLTALMATLAFTCVWPLLDGPGLLRGFVLVACATASAVYWSARPQIVSFALAGALLLVLEKGRLHPRVLVGVPVLLALWANLHGGFAIGLILIALSLAGEGLEAALAVWAEAGRRRGVWFEKRRGLLRMALVLAVSVAAVGLSPSGFELLRYPLDTVSIGPLRALIDEWQSPDFHRIEVWPFLGLVLAVVALLAYSPRRPRAGELLQLSALMVLAFMARRNIALFALGAAPVLGVHLWAVLAPVLAKWPATRRQVSPVAGRALNLAILVILALAAGLKLTLPLSAQRIETAINQQQPVGAIAYLQASHPEGALFNSYAWGGYLLWRLWPDYLTFVDGRTDLFAGSVLDDYVAAWNATEAWPSVMAKYGIDLALLEQGAPLTNALRAAGWATLYEDPQAVVFANPEE